MTENEYRAFLVERRANLRELYARYMEYGTRMHRKGLVTWSKKTHGWYCEFFADRPYKQRETVKMLMNLQRNIGEQAMLLLELEHALDHWQKELCKKDLHNLNSSGKYG